MIHTLRIAAIAGVAFSLLGASAQADYYYGKQNRTYEVTITNITKGQVFSPPVLVTHNRNIALFNVGEPALEELAVVAEDGAGQPLVDLVSGLSEVSDAQANSAPLMPGASAVYEISSQRGFQQTEHRCHDGQYERCTHRYRLAQPAAFEILVAHVLRQRLRCRQRGQQ